MSGQLNDLDNDSLLVLYTGGELANGEKAALEKRLANEPALAAELQRLREAQAFCAESMRAVDATQKMPVGEGVAVRRVSRAMQQWQVERVIAYAAASRKKGLPLPWWSYPVAVAASLIIAFLVWSSRQSVTDIAAGPAAISGDGDSSTNGADGGGGEAVATTVTPETEWISGSFGMINGEPAVEDPPVAPTAADDPGASMFPREETIQ